MKLKRAVIFCFMGGLTISAASACRWQYLKYHDSIKKWDKIFA
jgi:hypothetical protein